MDRLWNPYPRRIAIFRALKLGDMLCAIPALRAIRVGFRDAEIVLIGLPWAREFVERYRIFLDGFHEFPGFPGLPEQESQPDRVRKFFAAMRAERFELAIQLHGSGAVSNQIITQLGAPMNAGFYESESDCPDSETFMPYPERGLEVRRLLALVKHLGIPSRGEALEFPIRAEDDSGAREILSSHGLTPNGFVCVHGGASVPERRWPIDRFAATADALADRGLKIILTGSAAEKALTCEIMGAMRNRAIDIAGQTPLGVLGAVLREARLLVCNDTGISHLVDALRVPSVVISTGDNPNRWAPADSDLHRVLCRDSGVSVGEVIGEAEALLRDGSGPTRAVPFSETRQSTSHSGRLVTACDRCAS